MRIQTRNFGEIEINPQEIIEFRQPIYGFEHLTSYVVLSDDEVGAAFTWLQSTQDKDVCFVLVDPSIVPNKYHPVLTNAVRQLLELGENDQTILRTIAVIPASFQDATVNLKSPVIINPSVRCAAQVILEEDYPIRAPLISVEKGEGIC